VAKKASRGKGKGKGTVNRKTFLMEVEVSARTPAAPLYACSLKVTRVTSKPRK
jgi:hypothetical protein